eukprot:scaffold222692_cov39-Tisochrysis_lutea.AAC.1
MRERDVPVPHGKAQALAIDPLQVLAQRLVQQLRHRLLEHHRTPRKPLREDLGEEFFVCCLRESKPCGGVGREAGKKMGERELDELFSLFSSLLFLFFSLLAGGGAPPPTHEREVRRERERRRRQQ